MLIAMIKYNWKLNAIKKTNHSLASQHHTYRRDWHFLTSRAHQSRSVCLRQFQDRENMRELKNLPRHQKENCHHGNRRQRISWCPPLYPRSWSQSRPLPERSAGSLSARRRRPGEWPSGCLSHPPWGWNYVCWKQEEKEEHWKKIINTLYCVT